MKPWRFGNYCVEVEQSYAGLIVKRWLRTQSPCVRVKHGNSWDSFCRRRCGETRGRFWVYVVQELKQSRSMMWQMLFQENRDVYDWSDAGFSLGRCAENNCLKYRKFLSKEHIVDAVIFRKTCRSQLIFVYDYLQYSQHALQGIQRSSVSFLDRHQSATIVRME